MPKTPKANANDVEAAEAALIESVADTFDPDPFFARGDCRDAMLEVIRNAVDWAKFDESRQRDINVAVDNASRTIIEKLVKALASEGQPSIYGSIEQVVIKGGEIKIVLKSPFNLDSIVPLADAKSVLMRVSDAGEAMNERAPARIDPDQPDLIPSGPEGDQDLVDAADPPKSIMRPGDGIYLAGHGDCEVEVNLSTGMIEATPRNGDSIADRIDVREATPEELAAEREGRQDDIEEAA
jgi:hypothetical protein